MDKKTFSIREIFNNGWNRFGDNALAYIGATAAAYGIILVAVIVVGMAFAFTIGTSLPSLMKSPTTSTSSDRPLSIDTNTATQDTAAQFSDEEFNNKFNSQDFAGSEDAFSTFDESSSTDLEKAEMGLNILGELSKAAIPMAIGLIIVLILFSLLAVWLQRGFVNMSLKSVRGEKLTVSDLFTGGSFVNYYFANLLYQLVVWGPMLAVIVFGALTYYWKFTSMLSATTTSSTNMSIAILGIIIALLGIGALVYGVIMAVRFYFYRYFVLDGKLGPVNALKAASQMRKTVAMTDEHLNVRIFATMLVSFVLAFLGALGRIWTVVTTPVIYGSQAYTYNKLLQYSKENNETASV